MKRRVKTPIRPDSVPNSLPEAAKIGLDALFLECRDRLLRTTNYSTRTIYDVLAFKTQLAIAFRDKLVDLDLVELC